MKNIKVSIIIPVYNVESYLEECLDSAIDQSLDGIEIIAVNDGSTDDSLNILSRYKNKYSNLKIINQENKGLSGARNSGLKAANGKYVYFFDSDDIIDNHLIKDCYELAEAQKLDIVSFDASIFYDNEKLKINNIFNYDRSKVLNSEVMNGEKYYCKAMSQNGYRSAVPIYFFNREYLLTQELDFYEGILHEDELFTIKAILNSSRIMYIPKKYFKRRVKESFIMSSIKTERNVLGYYIVAEELYKFYINKINEFEDETKKFIIKTISRCYCEAIAIADNIEKCSNIKGEIVKSIKEKKIYIQFKKQQNIHQS